jgi:F-type H+-transporting ATPase subunit delta
MTSDVLGLSGRYADALLELAVESDAVESVEADAKRLRQLVADSADLRRFIESPVISRADHVKGLGAVLDQAGIGELTRKFVLLVASNRRLFALSGIIEVLLKKLADRRGEVTAAVTSARALSAAQKTSLAKALKKATGHEVNLEVAVDPKVLGGLVVRIGSRMVDSSLRSQLQRLQLAMKGVG